jgi:hypothetical protein
MPFKVTLNRKKPYRTADFVVGPSGKLTIRKHNKETSLQLPTETAGKARAVATPLLDGPEPTRYPHPLNPNTQPDSQLPDFHPEDPIALDAEAYRAEILEPLALNSGGTVRCATLHMILLLY